MVTVRSAVYERSNNRPSEEVVRVCVTGATGFIGAHVAKLAAEADGPPRVTYRDEARLDRLGDLEVEPVKADVLDRAALRRAFRGCEVVFHAAGLVASRPPERVWQVNALAPADRRRGGGRRGRAARGRDVERGRHRAGAAPTGPGPRRTSTAAGASA